MRRRWSRAVLSLVLAVGLAACSAAGSTPPEPDPESSLPVTTTAPDASQATPTEAPVGRPVQPVPVRDFDQPPPGPDGLARYRQQKVDWKGCAPGVQCADLRAPLDYAEPDAAAITLALARRPHSGASQGALFVNPGGPGGSGTDMVTWFEVPNLYRFDIVSWDVRGSGKSTAANCYGKNDLARLTTIDASPDTAAEDLALAAEMRRFGASCLAESGDLLNHVSTAETVRDLDLIRGVLGYRQISYLGYSYGTLIGSLYADRYPQRVARMVLDGAVSLDPNEPVDQTAGFERAFDHFASWCAERSCALGQDRREVTSTVQRLLLGLDEKPIPGRGKRVLTQQEAVSAVFSSLYGNGPEDTWPDLLRALNEARNGDGARLQKEADRSNFRRDDGSYGSFLYAFPAIRCLDSEVVSVAAARTEFEEALAQAPILAALSGPDYTCAEWPVPPAPDRPRITAKGAPPIVVIGSTGDPATPYEWAQRMAKQLDRGILVTRRGEGHTGFGNSKCINAIVVRYLLQGTPPKAETVC